MILRSWAFTGRKRLVLTVLCSAYGTLLAVEIWVFATDVDNSESRRYYLIISDFQLIEQPLIVC